MFGKLDGELTTNRTHPLDERELREREQVLSEVMAWNIGISWNASINKNFSYGISLSDSEYNFNAKKGISRVWINGRKHEIREHEIINLDSYDVTETLFSINASLRYRF